MRKGGKENSSLYPLKNGRKALKLKWRENTKKMCYSPSNRQYKVKMKTSEKSLKQTKCYSLSKFSGEQAKQKKVCYGLKMDRKGPKQRAGKDRNINNLL